MKFRASFMALRPSNQSVDGTALPRHSGWLVGAVCMTKSVFTCYDIIYMLFLSLVAEHSWLKAPCARTCPNQATLADPRFGIFYDLTRARLVLVPAIKCLFSYKLAPEPSLLPATTPSRSFKSRNMSSWYENHMDFVTKGRSRLTKEAS